MLKINIGLSRKVSADYQSKGYSLNLEGDFPSDLLNNHAALADAKNKLFDVANQLLNEQIQNDAGHEPASRVGRPATATYGRSPNGHNRQPSKANGYRQAASGGRNGQSANTRPGNGDGNGNGNGERLLTQAQTRAIQNMARKLGSDADQWVQDEFGVNGVGGLTIKQASEAIDTLKQSIEKVGV